MIAAAIARTSLMAARCLTGGRPAWAGGEPACGQFIYCANHTSHLDALLLLASLPENLRRMARPVAAADYWNTGLLRRYWTQQVFRTVLIDRESSQLNPLEPAFQALRQGNSLILFPEGTRGPGGSLLPLKPGVFHLARTFRQVNIVPVWIGNAHRILPKRARVPLPRPCSVTFGAPMRWEGETNPAEFLRRLRTGMESAAHLAECGNAVGQPRPRRFQANDV